MFGIFSDEGLIEGDFSTFAEATDRMVSGYSVEDGLHVAEICHDHPEQEAANCEECNSDDADEFD